MEGTKRLTKQACDSCGRDFMPTKGYWVCLHCKFDNVVGKEFAAHARKIAARKSASVGKETEHG